MKCLPLLFYLFILFNPKTIIASDIDFDEIIEILKNLTRALNNIDGDAQKYFQLLNNSWPDIMHDLKLLSNMPKAITDLIAFVDKSLPRVETCIYVFGGCLLLSSVICSITNIIKYNKKQRRRDVQLLFDENY